MLCLEEKVNTLEDKEMEEEILQGKIEDVMEKEKSSQDFEQLSARIIELEAKLGTMLDLLKKK